MAAMTPTKPDFYDGSWRGKIRVWVAPTYDNGSNTVTVPGIKRVFEVTPAKSGVCTWTSSAAANGLGTVLTFVVTASATGGNTPFVVYGQ